MHTYIITLNLNSPSYLSGHRSLWHLPGGPRQQVGRRDVVHLGQPSAPLLQRDRRGSRPREDSAQSELVRTDTIHTYIHIYT